MDKLFNLLVLNRHVARSIVLLIALLLATVVGMVDVHLREQQRLSLLHTEAQRSSIEIMSQTLNGNLMGSITLLGLIDHNIKQEAVNGLLSEDANISMTLSSLGNSFGAEGVFVVGEDGIVKSSWDRLNKPSTGIDVKFRPYYRMAMRGQNSVYAAVSMARGDRSLYFTAPVFSERARATSGIGAVVARSGLDSVDALMRDKFDIALLLSPQGVVFASNRSDWIGLLEGEPSPQRLQSIRELKQFGPLFEKSDPKPLPVTAGAQFQTLESRRFALASSHVAWNDPSGDWTLLVLEDLGRTVPLLPSVTRAAAVGVLVMLLGWMLLHLVRGRHTQALANTQLQAYARQQESHVAYRARMAAVSVKLQRCDDMAGLAQTFLTEARAMLGAQQGVIYVQTTDDSDVMHLLASSASSAHVPLCLAPAQGLLGQCAVEGRTLLLHLVEDGFWNLRSGLGHVRPEALLIAPIALQGRALGVVELALLKAPASGIPEQFEEMVALLAMNLEILRRNTRTPPSTGAVAAVEVSE